VRKIALIAGCSQSAGSEIDGNQDSRYNRDHSFGNLLANKLGYEPVNIAVSGSTNAGIARSIQLWFKEHYDSPTMEVFVIVGWTEGSRIEVPSRQFGQDYRSSNPDSDWYDITAGNYYRLNFSWDGDNDEQRSVVAPHKRYMVDNPIIVETNSINQILLIQYFLKSLNIEYVMSHTMHLCTPNRYLSYYLDLVDRSRYYELDADDQTSFYWKYRNLGYTNEKAKYWHHGEEPHRLHAEALYTFIKENNNVII
jgi:hypothetical protein